MDALERSIAKVESEISKVEAEVEAAGAEGRAEDEWQLRRKEEQLRRKEEQLREEKLIALRASGAPAQKTESAQGQSASADTLDKLAALVPFLQAMVTKITLRPDSSKSTARQLRQAAFKLGLYRYYYNSTAADVPPQLKCMVTGMMLSAKLVIAAHLIPRAHPEVAAIVCNIADVDSPRNGLLWAGPVEKAWTEHEIAFIPDKETRQLKFRVLTQSLMTTRLMDYNNQANLGETFGDHQFSAYDNTALLVQPGATPYRRALLLQAVNAVSQHAAAGDLRAGITCSAADFEVESDFENRPAVEAWVCSTLS